MKYLKTFEDLELSKHTKYEIGDYVKLKHDYSWQVISGVEIIDITPITGIALNTWGPANNYSVLSFFVEKPRKIHSEENWETSGEEVSFNIVESDIKRKLTPEEIEKFETLKMSKRYNL